MEFGITSILLLSWCGVGSFAKRDIDGRSGRHVFYVDKDIDQLLLIVKRTHHCCQIFFDCEEKILIEDEITHV
jgi:hypothetical protein